MEERNSFSIRNLILQILLVVLFVFIMIWLFPTKSYMDDKYVTKDQLIQQLQSIYGRNFADNVESMRDAAKGYFTTERLPEKVGDSVTLTLGEMLEKKMVLEFIDSNGNKCDTEKSYVKLTKMDTEYQLKVQLTCSDYSDYIIEYIGCYDFCGECEEAKPATKPTTPTKKPSTPSKKDPEPVVSKKYRYQYRLTTQNTYSNWSDWSAWSTTKVSANTLTQVEVDKKQEITGYEQIYKVVSYKTETYTDYETKTEKVATGTKKVLTSSVNPTTTSGSYGAWYDAGTTTTYDKVLYTTDTVKYTLTSTDRYLDCENKCRYVTVRYYKVQKRNWNQGTTTCPSGYSLEGSKCNKYSTETTYENKTVKVPVIKTKQVPVYGYVNGDPIYKTTTYYRYRTRTQLTVAGVTYAWGSSTNDTTLTSKGYVYTGYYEEV